MGKSIDFKRLFLTSIPTDKITKRLKNKIPFIYQKRIRHINPELQVKSSLRINLLKNKAIYYQKQDENMKKFNRSFTKFNRQIRQRKKVKPLFKY